MSYLIAKSKAASVTEYEWSDTDGMGKLVSLYDLPLQKTIYNNVEELLEEFGATVYEAVEGGLDIELITDDHALRIVYVTLLMADTLKEFRC